MTRFIERLFEWYNSDDSFSANISQIPEKSSNSSVIDNPTVEPRKPKYVCVSTQSYNQHKTISVETDNLGDTIINGVPSKHFKSLWGANLNDVNPNIPSTDSLSIQTYRNAQKKSPALEYDTIQSAPTNEPPKKLAQITEQSPSLPSAQAEQKKGLSIAGLGPSLAQPKKGLSLSTTETPKKGLSLGGLSAPSKPSLGGGLKLSLPSLKK